MSQKKTTGQSLREIDDKIDSLEELHKFLDPKSKELNKAFRDHPGVRGYIGGAGKEALSGIREGLVAQMQTLRDERARIVAGDPAPKCIVCPHCDYDGEFDKEEPEHEGHRLLEPVLSPRLILDYTDRKLVLSDQDDSHDPFDCIAEPRYFGAVDEEESPDYQQMRKMLRGQHLVCCGKCYKYFTAKHWIEKVHIDYPGESPHGSKWRK